MAHQAIVVFGRSGDTWTFDGSSWARNVPSLGGPSGRQGSTMAYEPSTGKVVMFGGFTEHQPERHIDMGRHWLDTIRSD
jgi:hypothetical protein